jgi:hypothetical protein
MKPKSKWIDISHSRIGRSPSSFERRVGPHLRLIVTRHIDLSPDEWRVSAQGVFSVDLPAGLTAGEAQAKCEALVEDWLSDAIKELMR